VLNEHHIVFKGRRYWQYVDTFPSLRDVYVYVYLKYEGSIRIGDADDENKPVWPTWVEGVLSTTSKRTTVGARLRVLSGVVSTPHYPISCETIRIRIRILLSGCGPRHSFIRARPG
jgi:hypothetical protein